MDSENRFWLGLWSLISVVAIAIIISCNIFYSGQEQRIVDMVEAGANPIESACAIYDTIGNSPSCIAIIIKD